MDYFKEYRSRELKYMSEYIKDVPWLSEFIKEVKQDNTSLHDLTVVGKNGIEYTVEVKEDEFYWFSRTGNIGLDYISSFRFENYKDKYKWPNLWVPSEEIEQFESIINVGKYGKLVTCDADFQFYFVLDDKKENFVFSKLYSNKKLKEKKFVDYLKNNYRLRINDKKRYGLLDSWDSAAFFINPLKDKRLIDCEVNCIEDMEDN